MNVIKTSKVNAESLFHARPMQAQSYPPLYGPDLVLLRVIMQYIMHRSTKFELAQQHLGYKLTQFISVDSISEETNLTTVENKQEPEVHKQIILKPIAMVMMINSMS